jgi:hypothetical protein
LPQRRRQRETEHRLGLRYLRLAARRAESRGLARPAYAEHRRPAAAVADHPESARAAEHVADRAEEALGLPAVAGHQIGNHPRERRVHPRQIFAHRGIIAFRRPIEQRSKSDAVRRHCILVRSPGAIARAPLEPAYQAAAESIDHRIPPRATICATLNAAG